MKRERDDKDGDRNDGKREWKRQKVDAEKERGGKGKKGGWKNEGGATG